MKNVFSHRKIIYILCRKFNWQIKTFDQIVEVGLQKKDFPKRNWNIWGFYDFGEFSQLTV